MMVFLVLGAVIGTASAQEALLNSLNGQSVAAAQAKSLQNQDYTFKYGDFRMLVSPYMSAQWNDNVHLSENNPVDDYILTPGVGINSTYPLTEQNVLFLDVTIGYERYLKHPNLSAFTINSTSRTGISFDIGIKTVTLNVHDWFSYTQDAAQSSAVANTQSGTYGTFQNTAGLSATWDLNQVTLSAGYDHQNVLATSAQYDYTSHSSELFFIRAGAQVHPEVLIGLETTATLTSYTKDQLNNNDAYTVGPYVTFKPGNYFQMTARGGYSTYQFQQTSQFIRTSSQNTWYADLNVTHQALDWMTYGLDAGHETVLGVQSDLTEDWYVRPNVTWMIIKNLNIMTGFFWEHGEQGLGSTGSVSGGQTETEHYDWYGGNLSLNHDLTSRLNVGLDYRLTVRSSDLADRGYTQNLVGLRLTYQFK